VVLIDFVKRCLFCSSFFEIENLMSTFRKGQGAGISTEGGVMSFLVACRNLMFPLINLLFLRFFDLYSGGLD